MANEVALERLKDRSYKSHLARVHATKRLRATGHWWNAAQISLTAAVLSVSIAFLGLKEHGINETTLQAGAILLAVVSVLALVVTIVSVNLDFSARAKEMFRSYRKLQAFSAGIELMIDTNARIRGDRLRALVREHQYLLDDSENHSTNDYLMSQVGGTAWGAPLKLLVESTRPYVLPFLLVAGSAATVTLVIVSVVRATNV